jgi:hypothetical protein
VSVAGHHQIMSGGNYATPQQFDLTFCLLAIQVLAMEAMLNTTW